MSVRIRQAYERWNAEIIAQIEAIIERPNSTAPGDFSDMAWYHLDTGGKRLRPLLVMLATEVLGGDPTKALPFACGVELIHNATLIHDDYQDGDSSHYNIYGQRYDGSGGAVGDDPGSSRPRSRSEKALCIRRPIIGSMAWCRRSARYRRT